MLSARRYSSNRVTPVSRWGHGEDTVCTSGCVAVIDGGVMMSMVVAVIDRAWLDFPTIKMSLLSVVTRIGFCVGCYAVLWLRIQLYADCGVVVLFEGITVDSIVCWYFTLGTLYPLVEGVMLSVMALLCLRAGPLIPGVLGRCIYWYGIMLSVMALLFEEWQLIPGVLGRCIYWYGLCCPSWLYCCLRETARGMLFVMAVLLFERPLGVCCSSWRCCCHGLTLVWWGQKHARHYVVGSWGLPVLAVIGKRWCWTLTVAVVLSHACRQLNLVVRWFGRFIVIFLFLYRQNKRQ